MVEKFASPQVFIRRHTASEICDVVVSVRGQEIVLRCPNYSQALKWARLECKSYKIPQPDIEPLSGPDHDELPLFLRSPEKLNEVASLSVVVTTPRWHPPNFASAGISVVAVRVGHQGVYSGSMTRGHYCLQSFSA